MNHVPLTLFLDLSSVLSAVMAAIYWVWSSYVKAPKDAGLRDYDNDLIFSPDNSIQKSGKNYVDLNVFYTAMSGLMESYKKQSRLSGIAAIFAAVSAFSQAISFLLKNP